jgi:hypothetical protein
MQELYWNKMTDKRYQLIYINEYYDQCIRIQRMINIFLAVTSSGAIAAWAVWKGFPVIWAAIIAVSQVITAVKPYLPYEKRIDGLYDIINQYTIICNEMEAKWFYVSKGLITEEQINEQITQCEKRWTDVGAKSLKGDNIPADDRLAEIAEEKKNSYFEINFNVKKDG